jgi:hypothetical protein
MATLCGSPPGFFRFDPASYLEVVDEGDDPGLRKFVRALQGLARANEGYEKGARTKADFDRWAPSALVNSF